MPSAADSHCLVHTHVLSLWRWLSVDSDSTSALLSAAATAGSASASAVVSGSAWRALELLCRLAAHKQWAHIRSVMSSGWLPLTSSSATSESDSGSGGEAGESGARVAMQHWLAHAFVAQQQVRLQLTTSLLSAHWTLFSLHCCLSRLLCD